MIALTSKDHKKAVSKYLLSFDHENWKILTDNYYKLNPFEAEQIIQEITAKLDIHMIMDILSISHIIGQSIGLSNYLIKSFTKVNITQIENQLIKRIEELLDSSYAEERRIGLLLAGYFDRDEFFDKIEKMSNYDILFEDAYFSLGLMTDVKIIELLSTKFMNIGKNQVQRNAIAKILARNGNPLAALWLFKNKGLDETTTSTKAIYLARDLAWAGILPHLFLESNDDYLQPMTIKMINGLAVIIQYDIELINEIILSKLVQEIIRVIHENPTIELIETCSQLKYSISELYYNIDPYAVNEETRLHITKSWKLLNEFPSKKTLHYITEYIELNLNPSNDQFTTALELIRNFQLNEYEDKVLKICNSKSLSKENEFLLISTLGAIGSENSSEFIISKIKQYIDFEKRNQLNDQLIQFHSDIDYYDDFDNEEIRQLNQTFSEEKIIWKEGDFEDIFYWNAIYALSRIKPQEALPIFLEGLNDYDPKIRLESILGLKELKLFSHEINNKLLSLIETEKFLSVEREAIVTLGILNSQEAIPHFLKKVYESIEDGTLAFVNEIIDEYDDRWEMEDSEEEGTSEITAEEIGATPQTPNKNLINDKKQQIEDDVSKWMKRLNRTSSNLLELREDFLDEELELTIEQEVIDDESLTDFLEETNPNENNLDETGEILEENEDEEWFNELGEKFKKITIVESVLEALKISKANVPIEEIKDLIEHPIDEELYKDALIILAKRNDNFAINELYGLFDSSDFIRAREIINALIEINYQNIQKFTNKIKESPDWILRAKIKTQSNS